jgi:ATP-binding cassette subfamily A (ABC1) protein 3
LQEPVDDVHSYVDEYWLRFAAENIQEYTRHYQLGFTAERDPSSGSSVFTVWYSSQFYHTCPSALSAFHNTYMNYLLTRYNVSRSTSSVTFVNHPLPRTQEGLLEQRDSEYAGFIISTTVVFGFSFLLAGFTLFLVNERAIKAKHLQFVSGVSTFSFWMANLVWDMLTSLVIVGLSVALFAAFQIQQFLGENICAVFLLMVALCWTGVPLSYCISFFFSSQLLSFAVTVMTMYFGSMIMTVVVWQVGIDNPDLADTLQYIFTPFPSFCIHTPRNNSPRT